MTPFEIISLTPPNKKDSTYLMADFVELICLADPDGEVSLEQAVFRVYHTAELETARELEVEERVEPEEHAGILKDRQILKGDDWFNLLYYRQNSFGEHYPFLLDERQIILRCDLTEKQLLYVFLLLCSNLRIFKNPSRNILTTNFEIISADVFRSYLPGFTVHHFGKSIAGRENYPNKLSEAILQLASNLKEEPDFDLEDFSSRNTGDGGLDLVAWRLPAEEEVPGSLICLAQCTCSQTGWEAKQLESHPVTWSKRIKFIHTPANFLFMPFCFRKSTGGWFNKDKIRDSIVMDRKRICTLLQGSAIEVDYYDPLEALYVYTEGI